MKYRGIPRYHLFRIHLFGILIYFMLIMPVMVVLSLKSIPRWIDKSDNIMKRISATDESAQSALQLSINDIESKILEVKLSDNADKNVDLPKMERELDSLNQAMQAQLAERFTINISTENTSVAENSFSVLFRVMLFVSLGITAVFNIPLKRYFNKKRKRKKIKPWLINYTRKIIVYTPYLNAGILLASFTFVHAYMFYLMKTEISDTDLIGRNLIERFFLVSLIASLLVVMFVYFWQRHRVQIIYIDHVFEESELLQRLKYFRKGKISHRLIISSTMTTLLPLAIVMLYVVLGLTPVVELGSLTEEQTKVLIGPYVNFISTDNLMTEENLSSLYYVNAIDNMLMFGGITMGIMVALIYIAFFVRWTTASILSPVKELLYNMRWTGEGHVDNYTIVRTNDEIGELSEGYNIMTDRLREYIDRISRMNEIYIKFVPQQFLHFLEKADYTDIKLGDQVQKEMTVLFSDIRSFTELSEEMSPKENFDFINHFLGMMEPVIRRNNGFIDKYIGDAIMALFPEKPDDAINAAIEMQRTLLKFNEERREIKHREVQVGIGIHSGNLMLGIIGGENRMEGTVISDAVNLASRLEGLTKTYGAAILMSEDTLIKIKRPKSFVYRFIDSAKVKGKRESVYIFEILNTEDDDSARLKAATTEDFGRAVDLYRNRKYSEALTLFKTILSKNPGDMVAQIYSDRCEMESSVKQRRERVE
jgi:class 3 adenylate cyclase